MSLKMAYLPVTLLWNLWGILLLKTVQAQSQGHHSLLTCPQGWLGFDGSCYKIFSRESQRTWVRAAEVCKSFGAYLVTIEDQYENNELGQKVFASDGITEFWTGLRYVRDPTCNCDKLYWDKDDRTVVSAHTAFWGDGDPDKQAGSCVYSSMDDSEFPYNTDYSAHYSSCESKRNFLCERPAAPIGSFFCTSGGFVNADNDVCDGYIDCRDGSDESNCLGRCSYKYELTAGATQDVTFSPYANSQTCYWGCETPLDSNAYVTFTMFNTETTADYVQIFEGATTEYSYQARSLAVLSGTPELSLLTFRSKNNKILVKFSSDNREIGIGFNFRCGSNADAVPLTQELVATTSWKAAVPPLFDSTFLGSTDYIWVIQADMRWGIITVEIESYDMSDTVRFYDGDSPSAPVLDTICPTCEEIKYVFSTGDAISILMNSDAGYQERGFRFNYTRGCDVRLTSATGVISSPGYEGNINYPNYQVCTWTIDTDQPITIHFDNDLQLQDSAWNLPNSYDYVQLFKEASDDSGIPEHGQAVGLTTSELKNKLFHSDNGKMFIRFVTSPIWNERGFKAKYSPDCEDPNYDAFTANYDGKYYTAKHTLTCALGYEFNSEAITTSSVELECLFGGQWNYNQLPRCSPVYCGHAPVPPSGYMYISASTGSTYGQTATYSCYPGSGLRNGDTVECRQNGQWSTGPYCETTTCTPGFLSPTITGGSRSLQNGDGSSIGTIYEYTCLAGYELVGEPFIFCQQNGTWSSTTPFCRRLTCFLPEITNGNFESTQPLEFEGVRRVNCASGYTYVDPLVTQVTCQSDRSLSPLPQCKNINECEPNNPCEQDCTDTEGSYFCTCDERFYTLNVNQHNCDDINECLTGTSNCLSEQFCTNSIGGYSCSCPSGYLLFTADGTSGYSIPAVETGELPTDPFYLQHTCVREECPAPDQVQNGVLMKNRDYHRYGDTVEFRCKKGYFADGETVLECLASGAWSHPVPTCLQAVCVPDSVPAGVNPPTYDVRNVNYFEVLTLTCTVATTTFEWQRQCLYDSSTDVYRLEGAPYECGVVDCGQPTDLGIPGLNVGTLANTRYNANFQFTCTSNNSPSGGSTLSGDTTVVCKENGYWDLGDLRCEANSCPDPGVPAGARMIAESFTDGSVVRFECLDAGFTLSKTTPLTCVDTSWSGLPLPSCIDTQNPTILSCPGAINIDRFGLLATQLSTFPPATDNVRFIMTVVPANALTTLVVTADLTVTFTATDENGNTDVCNVQVTVNDHEPPALVCPPLRTIILNEESDTATINVADGQFTYDSNDASLSFSNQPPATVTLDNLYQTYTYTATATDSSGNSNSCSAQIFVKPGDCSELSYETPRFATKECVQQFGGGYQCTLICSSGYVFRGIGPSVTVSCVAGQPWLDADRHTACIRDTIVPQIVAPTSKTVELVDTDSSVTVNFTAQYTEYVSQRVVDTNDIAKIEFFPDVYTFGPDDLYNFKKIDVQVTDAADRTAISSFQYLAVPAVCSPLSYPTPLNGNRVCEAIAGGYRCTVTCNTQYVLRDYGESRVATCFTGQAWDTEIIPACVLDTTPPEVVCPPIQRLFFDVVGDQYDITFKTNQNIQYSVTDAGGIDSDLITFDPPSAIFSQLYTSNIIKMTAVDRAGLSSSCFFEVVTLPTPCSPLALPKPEFGDHTCTRNTGNNGYRCTVFCDTGYALHDTTSPSLAMECFDGGQGWDLTNYHPACTSTSDTGAAEYSNSYEYIYETADNSALTPACSDYYRAQLTTDDGSGQSVLEQMGTRMSSICNSVILSAATFVVTFDTDFSIQPAFTTVNGQTINRVVMKFKFRISSNGDVGQCDAANQNTLTVLNYPLSRAIASNGVCSQLNWAEVSVPDNPEYICTEPFFKAPGTANLCWRCPLGMYLDTQQEVCSLCPIGSYRENQLSSVCNTCPAGSTTRNMGTASSAGCVSNCVGTQISSTGYAPCFECQAGEYRTDSTTCTSCGSGKTSPRGSISVDQCQDIIPTVEDCGMGTFEATPTTCQLCPKGTYNNRVGAGQCTPCGSGTTYVEGATSSTMCKGGCSNGMTSDDGQAPCSACPRGTYSSNSTYCQSCPQGQTTEQTGASSQFDCRNEADFIEACPPGTVRNANTGACDKCGEGTFSSTENSVTCSSCLAGQSTYITGATSSAKCFGQCAAGFTSGSTNGLSPCTACPQNFYFSVGSCLECPNQGATLNTNTVSAAGCYDPCPAGQFSYSGFGPSCRSCPVNFYSGVQSTACTECADFQYTENIESASSSLCLDRRDQCTTPSNPCGPGTCAIVNHEVTCSCPTGYRGSRCEIPIDYCSPNPCLNNGQCTSTTAGASCQCNTGTSGDRCETLAAVCTADSCQNGGNCVNVYNQLTNLVVFQCLCPAGFSGDTCEGEALICPTGILNPCQNGGTCTDVSKGKNIHRECRCSPGWTGKNCEENIDACVSNPCLHGGECFDELEAGEYRCECKDGYSGKTCLTQTVRCFDACGTNADCFEDYRDETFRCICKPGYYYGDVYEFELHVQTSVVEAGSVRSGIDSAAGCRETCEGEVSCSAFTFNTVLSVCTVYSGTVTLNSGSNINAYVKILHRPQDDYWTAYFDTQTPSNLNFNDDSERRRDLQTQYGLNVCGGTAPVDVECRRVSDGVVVTSATAGVTCDLDGLECTGLNACPDYEVRYKCGTNRVFSGTVCSEYKVCQHEPNPCVNANCVDTLIGERYVCSCDAAHVGQNCQTDRNECDPNPCVNGECTDRVGVPGFDCSCAAGYTGTFCSIPINYCSPDPCNNRGNCQSGRTAYTCDCYAGFTGTNCEDDTLECASSPCLHGGTCQEGPNSYNCDCTVGWEGNNCENPKTSCGSFNSPCENPAVCYNIFNDFYCDCPASTYGKTCETSIDPCLTYNKCLNGGTCSFNGVMTCQCPETHQGDGCEERKDLCGITNNCQNGGSCVLTDDGYDCRCAAGYTGDNCEQEIDECASRPCTGGGQCIDGIGVYFCECPLGKTGSNCDRDYDPDYDLYFRDGYAWIPHYLPVRGIQYLSVSVWVRFIDLDGEGTYFTMFQGDELTSAKRFMEFTATSARVFVETQFQLNGYVEIVYQPSHKLNDGNWHIVVVNLDMMTGSLTLIKNSIKIGETQNDGLKFADPELDTELYVFIGCDFDNTLERCSENNKFNGFVSNLNMYSRILSYTEEVPELIPTPRHVFLPALSQLLVWNNFALVGATRYIGSEATRLQLCTQGAPCRLFTVKERPVMTRACPDDIYEHSDSRLKTVQWDEPIFQNGDTVVSSLSPGSTLDWGMHTVNYVATSSNNNTATCSFKIYVSPNQCQPPADPLGGFQQCSVKDGFQGCEISCFDPQTFTIDRVTPKLFTCGPSGNWDINNLFTPFRYPSCGRMQDPALEPKKQISLRMVYQIGTLECSSATIEFHRRLNETFKAINICPASNCDNVKAEVLCSKQEIQGQTESVALISLTLSSLAQTFVLDNRDLPVEQYLTYQALGQDVLNYNSTIPKAAFDPNNFFIDSVNVCEEPRVLIDSRCVLCGAGNYFKYLDDEKTMSICDDCPIGQYQNAAGQTSCEQCPAGFTTETPGASSSAECKAICNPGSYYRITSNLDPGTCVPCELGYYQSESGKFYCDFCPQGKTTEREGSTSEDECYDVCPSGTELNSTGGCQLCPRDKYRDEILHTVCQDCPTGLIAATEGAINAGECTIRACLPGKYRTDQNVCEDCPIGTYQTEKWQSECNSCIPDQVPAIGTWTTDQAGSTLSSQCNFYCPSGYETGSGTECLICPIGKYKDNDDGLYGRCLDCTNNRRTESEGSTKLEDCTIYKCPVGQKPNADNTDCEMCPLGTYQNVPESKFCVPCPGDKESTRQTGSISEDQCETYCPSGEQKEGDQCVPCLRGFYKDNDDGFFGSCSPCRADYTTEATATKKAEDCKIRACPAGTKRKADESGCDLCAEGTYQPAPFQASCLDCTAGTSTANPGAINQEQCQEYCVNGEELTDSGCVKCDRGYYKDNDLGLFSKCTVCPIDLITETTGAESLAECNMANCSAGSKLDSNDETKCVACPIGTYQPDKWQTSCFNCSEFKTTENAGSVEEASCILKCDPGFEDEGDGCVPCPRGEYKTVFAAAQCTPCPTGTTTQTIGADDPALCNLPACTVGYYLDRSGTAVCRECDYDSYQDKIWQDECEPCPQGFVTLTKKATSSAACVLDCSSGTAYNPDALQCELCKRGYYRDQTDRAQTTCQLCPTEFITLSEGSISAASCNITNCTTPGEYLRVGDNSCQPCPQGQFAAEKWRTSCDACITGFTTAQSGSSSSSDCIRDCESGTYVTPDNTCRQCDRGSYRDRASGILTCTPCQNNRRTPSDGAVSQAECTLSPCNAGSYYIEAALTCELCDKGFYQGSDGSFGCQQCPADRRYTPVKGATNINQCRSPCTAGQKFDIPTEECEDCPRGFYQPEPSKFVCDSCPSSRPDTAAPGATSSSACLSPCDTDQNICSPNATCVPRQGSAVECICKAFFDSIGAVEGIECIHQCDNNYCANGECKIGDSSLTCVCPKWYKGDKCQTKVDSRELSDNVVDIVVPVVIGVAALILFVIIVVVCCLRHARANPKKGPIPLYTEYAPNKSQEQASLHSFDNYGPRSHRAALAQHYEVDFQNPGYDNAVYQAQA